MYYESSICYRYDTKYMTILNDHITEFQWQQLQIFKELYWTIAIEFGGKSAIIEMQYFISGTTYNF